MLKPSFTTFKNQFAIVPIGKTANNFSFICKENYISKIFPEIELNGITDAKYKFSSKTKDEIFTKTFPFLTNLD